MAGDYYCEKCHRWNSCMCRGDSIRPIIFSTPMVKAILAGKKTQTRRVIKPQPRHTVVEHLDDNMWFSDEGELMVDVQFIKCPYGQVGDTLYVRETHYRFGHWNKNGLTPTGRQKWTFKAENKDILFMDNPPDVIYKDKLERGWFKRPSIFMPKKYARIFLEITGVRVERVQDISREDIRAEGIRLPVSPRFTPGIFSELHQEFARLWDSINSKRGYSWESNPWVWVVEFEWLGSDLPQNALTKCTARPLSSEIHPPILRLF